MTPTVVRKVSWGRGVQVNLCTGGSLYPGSRQWLSTKLVMGALIPGGEPCPWMNGQKRLLLSIEGLWSQTVQFSGPHERGK